MRISGPGAILAALGASACCLGPVVLGGLGLAATGAAVSAFFAPLRPWLLALAFGIVGWRLVVLYRPGARTSGSNCDGEVCPPGGRRWERIATWGVLWIVALLAASPYYAAYLPSAAVDAGRPVADVPTARADGAVETCLAIEGMTCRSCARHVETALGRVEGVVEARVDFDRAEACVFSARPVSTERFLEAVARSGYRASLKRPL